MTSKAKKLEKNCTLKNTYMFLYWIKKILSRSKTKFYINCVEGFEYHITNNQPIMQEALRLTHRVDVDKNSGAN